MSLLVLAHEGGSAWSEFVTLLKDPAHWAFEGTTDIVAAVVGGFLLRPLWERAKARAIRQHDAEYHPDHEVW